MAVSIIRVRTPAEIDTASALVLEFFDDLRARYTEMLAEIDAYVVQHDVLGQLDRFAATFLPPQGECFLALLEGEAVGLVMLRRLDRETAEMNRMYVRGTARGHGAGRALGQAVVDEARTLGCREIRLDGLYRHKEALPLYESLGFDYYDDPDAFGAGDKRVIHMRLAL